MTTIAEFYRARIAEDHSLDPADIGAKLRIVDTFEATEVAAGDDWGMAQAAQMWVVVVILALVYADHPDFDPAWNVEV